MAFHDPIDITIDAVDIELFRTSTGENKSTYSKGDGTLALKAEHNYARRYRHVYRLDANKITPDPFIPSQNTRVSSSMYLVVDTPPAGYTIDELVELYKGLHGTLSASSYDKLVAFLGGQS